MATQTIKPVSIDMFENVLVLDDNDTNLGHMLYRDARKLADEQGLDAVLINATGACKVFKITDEGKWKYLHNKNHKRSAVHKKKEMHYNVRIEENDLLIKTNKVREFLDEGSDVLIVMNMKGREKSHPDLAKTKLYHILELLGDRIKRETMQETPGSISIVIHPLSVSGNS